MPNLDIVPLRLFRRSLASLVPALIAAALGGVASAQPPEPYPPAAPYPPAPAPYPPAPAPYPPAPAPYPPAPAPYPAPGAYPAPYPPALQTPVPEDPPGLRLGIFVGGLRVPAGEESVTALAGGVSLTFATRREGLEPRLYATFARVEDNITKTDVAALMLHDTYWFGGVYGLGFGGGLGYADFTRQSSAGWDDSSLMIIAYATPVMLRFGSRPNFELGLHVGATRFIEHDVRPFGYAFFALVF